MNNAGMETHLADKGPHVTGCVALCEAHTSIGDEVMPLALERLELSNVLDTREVLGEQILRQVRLNASSPFTERTGVV